jgi:hypothetical protein
MNALFHAAAALAVLLAATTASGNDQAANTADHVAQTQQANFLSQGAVQSNRAVTVAQAPAREQWRYRRLNGRWWYWTPANRWVVYQRNAWVPYAPGMFARQGGVVATGPVRRYSYAPETNAGYYPRIYQAPPAFGSSRSIRYAGSKINFDYAPYTGGSMQ